MATGDLISTTEAKTYLGISGSTFDTQLASMITQVSAALTKYCDRDSFFTATYTGTINGPGTRFLDLHNAPVVSVSSIVFDANESTTTTVTGSEFDLQTDTGTVMFKPTSTSTRWFTYGFQNLTPTYIAGYTTIPDDLKLAACMAVANVFNASKRDGTLQSEKIGDYSYVMKPLADSSNSEFAAWEPIRSLLFSGGYKKPAWGSL